MQRTALVQQSEPAGDVVTQEVLATCLMSWSGHTWRIPGEESSLAFFYKIHSGTLSLDKDIYLTPATGSMQTRAQHNSQYCRYQTYSDALKNSFFPRTIQRWNSLSSSVVSAQTTEEFKALI